MKKILLFLLMIFTFSASSVFADEVTYSISNYRGALDIHNDNSADFVQTITYQFDSDYNGQIVTLGKAGNVPKGFYIDKNPVVEAYKNGNKTEVNTEILDLKDGYEAKIYNAGSSGDTVKVVVHWVLHNMLFGYKDVAELNWVPVSDWDVKIEKLVFNVTMDKDFSDSQLWGHTGYFSSMPSVVKAGNSYTITADNINSKFELHGYWNGSVINSNYQVPSQRREKIIKQEKHIVLVGQFLKISLTYVIPILFLMLLIYNILKFSGLKKRLNQYNHFSHKERLYEAPEELSPLVLTQDIYGENFYDLGPNENKKGSIKFENLLQAVLLDLIDRKALLLEKESGKVSLRIHNLDNLADEELTFLDMAFGKESELPLDKLFSDYQYDHAETVKQLKKTYKGQQLETEVKKASSSVLNDVKRKSKAIKKAVLAHIKKEKRVSAYRPLTKEESRALGFIGAWGCLPVLLALGLMIYLIFQGAPQVFIYLALAILSLGIVFYILRKSAEFKSLGVVTEAGSKRLYQWQSFRNMIRDINSFNRTEIEGVIVWNRILVYATLFGYADRVEKCLKVNHIKLPEEFSAVSVGDFHYYLSMSTAHFILASSGAVTSSHFSVDTGSGGSSGGFSGGGGGGGGGAF